jgi:hypothetical protein
VLGVEARLLRPDSLVRPTAGECGLTRRVKGQEAFAGSGAVR